jgi:methionyl-tRNA formyltransferase
VHRVILITQQEFAEMVALPLQAAAPGLRVEFAWTSNQLAEMIQRDPAETRLISLGSDIIVPADLLNRLPGPAYNFHPGPPDYPGIFPSVFALYDGAKEFGVTLHEMAPRIDSGPIVAVDTFEILPEWDRLALDTATFAALQIMLSRFAPQFANVEATLPTTSDKWSEPRRTRRDFESLCHLGEDANEAEFARRYRAVGEGPEHAFTVTRFGRTFRLESERDHGVVRGGQPAKLPEEL